MNLQEALKENGKATQDGFEGYLSVVDGRLYRRYPNGVGHHEQMSFERSLQDMFQPYKEPHVCEPVELEYKFTVVPLDTSIYKAALRAELLKPKCKCGASLKATGWERV